MSLFERGNSIPNKYRTEIEHGASATYPLDPFFISWNAVYGDAILDLKILMPKQPTLTDVAETLNVVVSKIEDLAGAVHGLSSHMDTEFEKVRQETKAEFEKVRQETKEGLEEVRRDVVDEIDRFVVLHQRLDVEYVSLTSRCNRIEDRLDRNKIN
jgi:hypothetical protein